MTVVTEILEHCKKLISEGHQIDTQGLVHWIEDKLLEMEKQQIIEFANWLEKLTPSQKVSVWSKDGSASGLFTMDNEQLFEEFKKQYKKTFL